MGILLRGYDLDGTLCTPPRKREKPYFRQSGAERAAYEEYRRQHAKTAGLIRQPEPPFVVITGRPERYRGETEVWLRENGLRPVGLFMMETARTRKAMISHKAAICKEMGVAVYFEDDPKIAAALAAEGIVVARV